MQHCVHVTDLTISIFYLNHLDGLKSKVLESGGGIDPETGNIKNPKEEEKVFELMVGSNKSGEAYKLVPLFEAFIQQLTKLADPGTKFSPLALDAKDDPTVNRDGNQSNKDFAELNFAQTPVPAALASLSQKQAEIRRYESDVLNQLAAKVGAKEIKFDKVFAQVSANDEFSGSYKMQENPYVKVLKVNVKEGKVIISAEGLPDSELAKGKTADEFLLESMNATITFTRDGGKVKGLKLTHKAIHYWARRKEQLRLLQPQ